MLFFQAFFEDELQTVAWARYTLFCFCTGILKGSFYFLSIQHCYYKNLSFSLVLIKIHSSSFPCTITKIRFLTIPHNVAELQSRFRSM